MTRIGAITPAAVIPQGIEVVAPPAAIAIDQHDRAPGRASAPAVRKNARVATATPMVCAQARLDGGGAIELRFDKQLEDVFALFRSWEARCKAQGFDVQFCIGAGDLRRAVLGLPVSGPGDFELFVHLRGHRLQPLRLLEAMRFLRERGVDIETDLHGIFGASKKLDVFVKDERSLTEGGSYCGEFGFFDGMGDTSLNQLVFAPSEGVIHGASQNLDALRAHRISNTELEKCKRLDEPLPITGLTKKADYKATILRLALRAIRLKIDLALAPNPNGLTLDASFDNVLAGFKLYFERCTPDEIARYAISDAAYIEQFCKIFRNRSNADLAVIQRMFKGEFAETYAILMTLGLDVDVQCKRRAPNDNQDARERRAVIKNARYHHVQPLVSATTMKVSDPFASIRHARVLIDTMKGRNSEQLEPVPHDLLALYSPQLAREASAFPGLELETQRVAIGRYVDALAFFASPAAKRVTQVGLRETFFERLALPEPNLAPKDPQTLLTWVRANTRPEAPFVLSSANAFNATARATLTEGIRGAIVAGKVPTIFVDLDDSTFDYTTRLKRILDIYDRVNGTAWFADVSHFDLPRSELSEFLYAHLGKHLVGKALADAVVNVDTFVGLERNKSSNVEADDVLETTRALLTEAVKLGAVPHYLSMRSDFVRNATMNALTRGGLPLGEVTLLGGSRDDDAPSSPGAAKRTAIETFCEAHAEAQVVGLIDNDPRVMRHVRKALPTLPTLLAVRRHDPKQRTTDVFFATQDSDLYRIFARSA